MYVRNWLITVAIGGLCSKQFHYEKRKYTRSSTIYSDIICSCLQSDYMRIKMGMSGVIVYSIHRTNSPGYQFVYSLPSCHDVFNNKI